MGPKTQVRVSPKSVKITYQNPKLGSEVMACRFSKFHKNHIFLGKTGFVEKISLRSLYLFFNSPMLLVNVAISIYNYSGIWKWYAFYKALSGCVHFFLNMEMVCFFDTFIFRSKSPLSREPNSRQSWIEGRLFSMCVYSFMYHYSGLLHNIEVRLFCFHPLSA